jgi:hypothetical protein
LVSFPVFRGSRLQHFEAVHPVSVTRKRGCIETSDRYRTSASGEKAKGAIFLTRGLLGIVPAMGLFRRKTVAGPAEPAPSADDGGAIAVDIDEGGKLRSASLVRLSTLQRSDKDFLKAR